MTTELKQPYATTNLLDGGWRHPRLDDIEKEALTPTSDPDTDIKKPSLIKRFASTVRGYMNSRGVLKSAKRFSTVNGVCLAIGILTGFNHIAQASQDDPNPQFINASEEAVTTSIRPQRRP